MSVNRIGNGWHSLASICSTAAPGVEVGIFVNDIALRTTNVTKAGSTVHSLALLNLLVDSQFRRLWPRLLIALLTRSVLYLRN